MAPSYDRPMTSAAAPRGARRIYLANLIAQIAIFFSGALVRLTGSGLGCPSWPQCVPGSYIPVREQPQAWHKYIEFGNRTLTFVLVLLAVAAVGAGVWHSRALRRAGLTPRPQLLKLSFLPFLGTVAQTIAGGITVLTHLNPAAVAFHLLLSIAIVGGTLYLVVRAGEPGDNPVEILIVPWARRLGIALVPVAALVISVGTIVTGSGPHAGDASAPRFHLDPRSLSWLHADLVLLFTGLSIGYAILLLATGAPARCRRVAMELLAMIGLQGVIGYTQYFTGLPEGLVAVHVLGSSILWIAVLRVPFSQRRRGLPPALEPEQLVAAGREDRPTG